MHTAYWHKPNMPYQTGRFFRLLSIAAAQKMVKAKHKTQKQATVDLPEECYTGGMGRFLGSQN